MWNNTPGENNKQIRQHRGTIFIITAVRFGTAQPRENYINPYVEKHGKGERTIKRRKRENINKENTKERQRG